MTQRSWLGVLGLLASACSPAPVVAPPTAPAIVATTTAAGARVIPLVRRGDVLCAAAEIDGRPVGEFLLDTGAAVTFVDRTLADTLRLPSVMEAKVQGALFDTTADVREVRALTVAGIRLDANPTIAVDLRDAATILGTTLTGIIGFHSLGTDPFTIDFPRATLTLHDRRSFAPPAGVHSELLRINQVPYVEATLENGPLAWLQLDTGAGPPVTLWRGFVKQYADVLTVPQKRWVQTVGIGGSTQVMQSELRALRIFGRNYGATSVLVHDAPAGGWHHPRVAGRVGASLLRDLVITIDPHQRRIWVATP